jgi:malate dehydrogenase
MIPLTRLASTMEFQCLNFFQKRQLQIPWWWQPYGALGTSAWYAPGASVAYLVDSILNDQKKMIACSVFLLKESMSKMIFVLVFLV